MMERRTTIIVTLAAAHFVLTAAMLFIMGASSMADFDAGHPSGISTALLNGAFHILCLPLVTPFLLLQFAGTGMWGWLVFLANSLLWGWAGWRLIRHFRIMRGVGRPAV